MWFSGRLRIFGANSESQHMVNHNECSVAPPPAAVFRLVEADYRGTVPGPPARVVHVISWRRFAEFCLICCTAAVRPGAFFLFGSVGFLAAGNLFCTAVCFWGWVARSTANVSADG